MNLTPSRWPRALGCAMLVAVVALLVVPASSATAAPVAASTACVAPASESPSDAIDLTATIVGSPCVVPTDPNGGGAGAGTAGSGSRPGAGGSANVPPANVTTAAETFTLAPDEVDLAGILNIGGLSTWSVPSLNPLDGTLLMRFTVRNASDTTIDATADFWMNGWFGNRISAAESVRIDALKPGETRSVSAELRGVGQWTFLSAHATLTPPSEVESTELAPMTRDALVFALPWFVVLVAAVGLAAWVIVQVVRRGETFEPAGLPA